MNAIIFNYIFFFGFLGIYCSLMPGHFADMNLSGGQVAQFYTIIPAISIIFNLFWGSIADKFQIRHQLNYLLPLIAAISFFAALYINTYQAYVVLAIMIGISVNPIMPLTDSLAISHSQMTKSNYGKLRQFGTISFSLINFTVIIILFAFSEHTDILNNHNLLYIIPLFLFFRFLSGLKSPNLKWKGNRLSLKDFLKVISQKYLFIFFLASMVHSMSFVANYVYFTPYLKSLDYSLQFITFCWAISPILEIFVFRYSQYILERFSIGFLFKFSLLSAAGRWLLLYYFPTTNVIIWSQLLHTFVFGTYFLCVIQILAIHIPENIRNSGQGFFTAFVNALGMIIANPIFGYIKEVFSLHLIFLFATFISLIAFAISLLIPKSFFDNLNGNSKPTVY